MTFLFQAVDHFPIGAIEADQEQLWSGRMSMRFAPRGRTASTCREGHCQRNDDRERVRGARAKYTRG